VTSLTKQHGLTVRLEPRGKDYTLEVLAGDDGRVLARHGEVLQMPGRTGRLEVLSKMVKQVARKLELLTAEPTPVSASEEATAATTTVFTSAANYSSTPTTSTTATSTTTNAAATADRCDVQQGAIAAGTAATADAAQ
jgi:hypothetical protein